MSIEVLCKLGEEIFKAPHHFLAIQNEGLEASIVGGGEESM
jgi:hypothetical protein